MQDKEREIDLEIVSNSWLSLNEPRGFDRMIASWSRKIDAVPHDTKPGSLIDRVVARQLEPIEQLLSSPIEIRTVDPLEQEAGSLPSPTIILSPDGTVATAANGGDSFFGVRAGRFAGTAWLDDRSASDYAALRRSVRERGNTNYAILRVNFDAGSEGLAEAYPLEVPEYGGVFMVIRSLELDWSPAVDKRLEQAFDLTPAEVDICRLLFRFRDLDLVNRHRGVTRETGRTQLKRIFGKTEVHSKAELIRLLAMLCARGTGGDDSTDLTWSDPLGRERIIRRPDGRSLAYSWIGAEHGREALFIHGEIPLFYLTPATQEALAKANVKLICVSMPGHGSSDPPPKDVTQMDDGLAALETLIAHLGGKTLAMAACYSGQYYAMLLGARAGILSAVVLLGMPWSISPAAYKQLPIMQKTLAQLAKRSPRMFDMVCRLGWKMILREGPDFYLNRAYIGSDADEATVADADIQPYLRAACRHLLAQGHHAFVRENENGAYGNPRRLLKGLQVPLHWLVPGDLTTNTPENCRAAKSMNAHITVETVAGAGGLLPYQRSDIFVRCMTDLVSDDVAQRFASAENIAKGMQRA